MGYCNNCGCREYNGACTNCHEEIYIAQQYYENGDYLPPENTEFTQRLRQAEREVKKKEEAKGE